MAESTDAGVIERGLRLLWPDDIVAGGELVLFEPVSRQWRRFREIASAALVLALGFFVYASCALVRNDASGRGRAQDAIAIPGVWLDLDLKGGKHSKQNLPTLEEALDFLRLLPLQPTLILHSGGGLYVWWLFAEVWVFESPIERERAAQIVEGWQRFVISLATTRGWHIDNTASLGQLLRAEGCVNCKYEPARRVHKIDERERRWNPIDFGEWIELVGEPEPAQTHAPKCAPDKLPIGDLRDALACIDCSRLDYSKWRNVGFGLHDYSDGADAAFELWDAWSATDNERYEGTGHLRALWDRFGNRRPGQRRVTILSLAKLARDCGWTGRLPELDLVELPEPIEPTRAIVHDIDEAVATVREIAKDWVPGTQSNHIQAWPGSGKTRTFGEVSIEKIAAQAPGWTKGAVLALPERALVEEKAAGLRRFAKNSGLDVPVATLLGRSLEANSGWYCERFEQASLNAELHRRACSHCPLAGAYERDPDSGLRVWVPGACAIEPGRYLYERELALGAGGLLVATHEALRHAFDDIGSETPLILDDSGPLLGVVQVIELRLADISCALDRVEAWRANTRTPAIQQAEHLADVFVADIVRSVLRALHERGRFRSDRLTAAIRALRPELQQAIVEGSIKSPRDDTGRLISWPWEEPGIDDGRDGSPAFSRLALALAYEVLVHGCAPLVERVDRRTVERGGAELRIHLPDRELIDRARAGRVTWLAVAPAPGVLLERLNVKREVIHADPRELRLVVGELRLETGRCSGERIVGFGPGTRPAGAPSPEDEVVRAIARAMSETHPSFGAVLLKADREALGSPAWCRSYGSGHAGSDALAHCEYLVIRRYVPPYQSLAIDACVLRRTFGLDGESNPPGRAHQAVIREARRWRSDHDVVPTVVPADLLERELLLSAEAHAMLNAAGRSRPLSSGGRRYVLVLCGRPFALCGARVEVIPLATVLGELGVLDRVALPSADVRRTTLLRHNLARQQRVAERRKQLGALCRGGTTSRRALAKALGCDPRTVERDLATLKAADAGLPQGAFQRLRQFGRGAASSDTRCIESPLSNACRELAAAEVLQEVVSADGLAPSLRTVRRLVAQVRRALRSGAELVLPERSDARRNLNAVMGGMVRLLEREPARSHTRPQELVGQRDSTGSQTELRRPPRRWPRRARSNRERPRVARRTRR